MWKLHYLITVLSFSLAVVFISKLLRERRAPGSTVAWLLILILFPHLGVPCFFILGNRKLKAAAIKKLGLYEPIPYAVTPSTVQPMERLLLASGVPQRTLGNKVTILPSGEEAYLALVRAIQEAQHRIHIATYVLSLDEVGKKIVALLSEKARAGVEVRLLLDGLGSFGTFRWRLADFRRAGGRVAYFLPLVHLPFIGHSTNLRNHRKLVTVDGRKAILGGMNLAREYMGPIPDPKRWVDLSLEIEGEAVGFLESIFTADWRFASREDLRGDASREQTGPGPGTETLQVVASGPDVAGDTLYDSIISAIFAAKTRIWMTTPYFIPDETLGKALELAAKRGVEVRLLVPRKSNHFLADLCRSGYLKQLELAGGRISYFPDTMMHAKAMIVDDLYAILGSANLDMRSLLLNYEVGLFLYSKSGIEEICRWFESLRARSIREPLKGGLRSEMLEGIGRILGPFL